MDRDDIIRIAEQAGVHEGGEANWVNGNRWELFAILAYEAGVVAEREACAKVCEAEGERIDASWLSCAAAIRARGQE